MAKQTQSRGSGQGCVKIRTGMDDDDEAVCVRECTRVLSCCCIARLFDLNKRRIIFVLGVVGGAYGSL